MLHSDCTVSYVLISFFFFIHAQAKFFIWRRIRRSTICTQQTLTNLSLSLSLFFTLESGILVILFPQGFSPRCAFKVAPTPCKSLDSSHRVPVYIFELYHVLNTRVNLHTGYGRLSMYSWKFSSWNIVSPYNGEISKRITSVINKISLKKERKKSFQFFFMGFFRNSPKKSSYTISRYVNYIYQDHIELKLVLNVILAKRIGVLLSSTWIFLAMRAIREVENVLRGGREVKEW